MDEVKVEQVDRDASAKLAAALKLICEMQGIVPTIEDDFAARNFARHRLASQPVPAPDLVERVAREIGHIWENYDIPIGMLLFREMARASIAIIQAEAWQPIQTAPYNEPVKIKVGEGMEFVARLIPDGSMSSEEESCDQWVAEHEGEHPECWSGGACWESNEGEVASLQPTRWKPLATAIRERNGG